MDTVSLPGNSLEDAMTRLQAGAVDEALSILRGLVQGSPSSGHAHALIGICHAQKGDLEAAVKSLETAALLNPHDPAVEYNLANALFQVGRLDKATWRLSRVLEADPEHEDAKALLDHIRHQAAPAPPAPAAPGGARSPAVRARPAPPPGLDGAPNIGLRILRGLGWGVLYAQVWTLISLIGVAFVSLFATLVEHAIIAFLLLATLTTLFHSAMGVLLGLVAAVMNADEDAGGWIGACVGLLILLAGLRLGFLAIWSVVFYLSTGWKIGRAVTSRVQKPVAG